MTHPSLIRLSAFFKILQNAAAIVKLYYIYCDHVPVALFHTHISLAIEFCAALSMTECPIRKVGGQLKIIHLECLIFWNNLFLSDVVACLNSWSVPSLVLRFLTEDGAGSLRCTI